MAIIRPYTPAQRTAQVHRAGQAIKAGYVTPNPGPMSMTRTVRRQVTPKAVDPMTRITNRLIANMLTPQQQQSQAAASVNAQIKLALAGMQSSAQAAQTQASQQAARAQQYALALNSMRDMSGAQTEADYQNAAARVQGLGTGLTGTVAEAQQAGANDAAARIAAATGGLGQTKGLDVAGLQNVAQFTGVTQPATNLYEEAASQAAQARLRQDVRGANVESIVQDYLQKGTEAQQELQRKRTELETTRPSLYQAALQSAQGGGRSDMATIISALALRNQAAQTPSKIAATQAGTKKTQAGTAQTKTTTRIDVGKAYGTTPDGTRPLKGNYFVGTNPKTRVAQALPPHTVLDPKDPTYTKYLPDPNNPPTGEHYDPKTKRFVPNPGTKSTRPPWQNPDGSMDTSHYYRPSPGAAPAPIPRGFHVDTTIDPHHLIKDPPPASTTTRKPVDKAKQIQSLIRTWSSTIDKSLMAAGSPYVHDIADPYEVSKHLAKSHFVPSMTYPAAFAAMMKQVPPSLRSNPQMIANVNATLRRGGYTIGGAAPKPKAKPTKPKTIVGKNIFGT